MPKQDLATLVDFFYDRLMREISREKSLNLIWLYFVNNKKQSALLMCTIICIVSHYSNKRKATNSGSNNGGQPPSFPQANSPLPTSSPVPVQNIVENQDNSNPGAELAHELLLYIGILLIITALFCLFVELAVGGTGLVIGIWGLSLAIEHVIAGMLISGASCFAASASVHYVYELSLENKEDSQNNNNLLNIKP